jgi:CheY-like chemotaxis protein
VRACQELAPEVLVVDLRLGPGIDGLEVARRVARPGLHIVLHTNYVNAAVVDEARQAGVVLVEKGSLSSLRRAVANGEPAPAASQ